MSNGKFFLICLIGLSFNLFGYEVIKIFNLPVYMDTLGTIFIAALGGYVPGIAVGFFTNLIKAFYDPAEMYFCTVSVAVAIITTFFARIGFFDKFSKILTIIPILTFVTGTCDLLIEIFLRMTDIIEPVRELNLSYLDNFLYEFIDKGFAVIVAFYLLNLVSEDTKNFFRFLGQKQAPLSKKMKHAVKESSYLSSSLRTKMLLILTFSSLFVSFSIALISYLLFKDTAIDERIKTVNGLAAVAINEINPHRVDDYLRLGHMADGYKEIEEKLYAIKNSSLEVKYLYVYRILPDGCHVVFDLNVATMEGDKPGQIVPFDASTLPYKDDLIAGKPIPPIISDDEYGYLLTLYKPVYDDAGKCQCYMAIDFSMDMLIDYTRTFIIKLIALFTGCFVFIFAIGLSFVENNIILPVNTMAYCAKNFSYDSVAAREQNIEMIKDLKIKTGDEIENLYAALIRTTENVLRYLEHLQKAKIRVADMQVKVFEMDKIAHKDSLTGIKNKTAYAEKTVELDKKIATFQANFCIVMVDVNFLKRVNDTYGHELGNTYLINACKLVCAVFGEDHVYRVGGDEFVVVMEGEKVSLCKYFVSQFKFDMERKNANESLKPWEKVSAAVGMAIYDSIRDKNAESVFKRADKEMYENKLAMKAARTS